MRRVGTADNDLQTLLKQHHKNFETALSEVQNRSRSGSLDAKARLDRLQGAIVGMFNDINRRFEVSTQFEFSNTTTFSVKHFLARFDAIFTLNQDSLLELHYRDAMEVTNPMRWNGMQMPGIVP